MSVENLINFPLRAGVEEEFVERIKEVIYEFSGRVTIAQCIGCVEIAIKEIVKEQPK